MNAQTIIIALIIFNALSWLGFIAMIFLVMQVSRQEKDVLFRQISEMTAALISRRPVDFHMLKEQIHDHHIEESVDNTGNQGDDDSEIIPLDAMEGEDLTHMRKNMLGR